MNIMQVLIVDANPAVRNNIAEIVIVADHHVVQASNSEEALNHLQHHDVDLVFIDYELSGSHFEVIKAMRTLRKNEGSWFPIILMTQQADDTAYAGFVHSGGDSLLMKPVSENYLQAQIISLERTFLLRKKLQAAEIGLVKLNDTLKFLSMFDQLTGLPNRRNFADTLRREFKLAQREKMILSLVKCNIDFFKRYNEHYGQKAGDDCLCTVATAIASVTQRPTDFACRYGGDEFMVILPKTDNNGIHDICDKILKALNKRKIQHQSSPVSTHVSLSIGAVSFDGQFKYAHEFVNAVDEALYCAKINGRNCIECYS